MDASALGSAAGPGEPGWGDARRTIMWAAELCAAAVTSLSLRGAGAGPAMAAAREATGVLRDLDARLRCLAFDEAVIEAERDRAVGETLAALGIVPAPRERHLHAVT